MHAKKQQIAVMLVAAGLGLATAGFRAQETLPPDQGRASETDRDTPPQDAESYHRPARSNPADMKHDQQIKASKLIGREVKNRPPGRNFERETADAALEREPVRAVQGNGARQLITHPDHANLFAEPLFGKGPTDTSRAPATVASEETMPQRGSDSLGYRPPGRNFERETADTALEREPVRAVQGNGARQLITHPDHADLFAEPLFGKGPTDTSRAPATDASEETMPQRGSDDLRYSQPGRNFERETADTALEREPVRAVQGNGARQLITHPDHADLFAEPLFGKGPTDNSRAPATDTSDETMQQRISDSLQQISTPGSPQTVSVTVHNGIVTLRGTVADDTEKRNTETTVKQMSGVRRVNNQLTVQSR